MKCIGFIGQSVGNYMFTVSDTPPPCPANCYMLNRSTLTWGPVTGNGAIEYARRLNQITGEEIRLYNACWDSSAMVATYAPPTTPNLYWTATTSDSPLYSLNTQVTAGGYIPNLWELNQGQAEWNGMSDPNVWANGCAALYADLQLQFSKTAADMPLTIWTGMRGGAAASSPSVLAAHQLAAATITGAALGISYYDGGTVDLIHPTAFSHQANGARAATFALKRLGNAAYAGVDNGPRIVSADRWGQYVYLTTSGHPLRQDGAGLTGFQAWSADWMTYIPVGAARVIDPCTILVTLAGNITRPNIGYQRDCVQSGASAVYDTQQCFVKTLAMPMVPCTGVQSAT